MLPVRGMSLRKASLYLALTVAVTLGGWSLHFIHVRHRLGVVAEGQVYKSGTMPPSEMAAVAKRLGLRTVIDLRTWVAGQDSTNTTALAKIQAEGAALAAVGVRQVCLPTPQVPTAATVAAFLKIMDDPANRPVLIHCYHGIGRTELFAALYRMEYEGWSNQRARADTRFFLPGSSFSDTSDKGRFLMAYHPRAYLSR